VNPLVHLLWAHLTIHIHDELLLVTQMHAPLIDNFDPLSHLKEGQSHFYDNVNTMWHTPDAQHWELGNLLEVNHDSTTTSNHFVLAINQHRHEFNAPNCCHVA
jgi:hypothetical protein